MTTGNGQRLLSGYKVLDFTQIVAGPTTTKLMAEMGAEVIKVEQAPKGDPARLNPVIRKGRSAYFLQHNLGKQSLCVNLKTEAGRNLVRELVPHMDVVVENYSPGVMKRMGFSYDEFKTLNPRLVMCSISALGQTGPLAHLPGFDYIAQAYAGITELIGEPGQPPSIPMAAIGDVSTGVHALAAIACALLYRERTGEGQYIDVSLLDTYMNTQDFSVQTYTASNGKGVPTRGGSHHAGMVPLGVFRGPKGSFVLIIAALEHQWRGLTKAMGRPEMADDPRFNSVRNRLKHKELLIKEVETWLQSLPDRETVLSVLERERVPVAPILTIPELVTHPHLLERGAVRPMSDPLLGDFMLPGFPFRFSTVPPPDRVTAPDLGEHNHEVLTKYLKYNETRVAELASAGVLASERTPRGER
jgi:crotonobetainyl-CoA:carnitine CoA-transferase CaiB-like acyl-CoA transferase